MGAGAGRRHHAVHPHAAPTGWPTRTPAAGCPPRTGCWPPGRSSALGSMAYSLYLWHWPLLIFWLVYTGTASASDFLDGAGVLVVSGVLAWLTTKYVENPLRYRTAAADVGAVGERCRCAPGCAGRRSCSARWSTLLGVALTATSFTWREHVIVQTRQRQGADRPRHARLSRRPRAAQPRPGARSYRCGRPCWRPRTTSPRPPTDGCISDFDNVDVINCTYGDKSATRTIALAGGSHAEHWITALDLLGQHAPLQGGDLPEDGLPADHRAGSAGDGRQPALPQVPRLERPGDEQAHRRPPRLRLHHRRPGRGTSSPAT